MEDVVNEARHRGGWKVGPGWAGPGWLGRIGGGGGCAGVLGTSETWPKGCNRFGVKDARKENWWAKIGGSGPRLVGSGQKLCFVGKKLILWAK